MSFPEMLKSCCYTQQPLNTNFHFFIVNYRVIGGFFFVFTSKSQDKLFLKSQHQPTFSVLGSADGQTPSTTRGCSKALSNLALDIWGSNSFSEKFTFYLCCSTIAGVQCLKGEVKGSWETQTGHSRFEYFLNKDLNFHRSLLCSSEPDTTGFLHCWTGQPVEGRQNLKRKSRM